MAILSRVQFHLDRERQCREMAGHATDRAVIALHNQLADHHAAIAAMEMSRREQRPTQSPTRPESASERLARQATAQNPLARMH